MKTRVSYVEKEVYEGATGGIKHVKLIEARRGRGKGGGNGPFSDNARPLWLTWRKGHSLTLKTEGDTACHTRFQRGRRGR
jgi:hypothetical protein